MKNKKNIFIILVIVTSFFSLSDLNAQTFIQSDLDRLINNHPLMKNYDRNTGFFKNTPYDKIEVEKLVTENASLSAELKEVKAQKLIYSQTLISGDTEDNNSWSMVSQLDSKEKELANTIENNKLLIANDGYPSKTDLSKVIDNLSDEVLTTLFNNNQIVLNKLPLFNIEFPKIVNKDLREFFYRQEEKTLRYYLNYSTDLNALFENSRNVLIYQNNIKKSGKIAKINLARILILHPRMSLFDYNRFGFYRINSLNLPENKFSEKIMTIKSSYNYDYTELNKAKNNLKEIQKKLHNLRVFSKNKSEEDKITSEKLEIEYSNKEKELLDLIDSIRYKMVNCDLTSIEETKVLLSEIEQDVLSTIKNYAENENIELVFNNFVPFPSIDAFSSKNNNKLLGDLFADRFYYQLLRKNESIVAEDGLTQPTRLIRWLEILKNPRVSEKITNENFPFILFGGERIDNQIIDLLYKKYKIDASIAKKICSIISETIN